MVVSFSLRWRTAIPVLLVALGAWISLQAAAVGQDPGANAGPGTGQGTGAVPDQDPSVQVLTRGPVHEAFAAPVNHDPKPGLIAAKEPPSPVEELPPDQKPAGQNVQWIPGYWSWDQSRNDYLWVSGVWREPPPGRQWVPGYWHQVDGGFQWVPGAWVPVSQPANGNPSQAASGSQAAYMPASARKPGNGTERPCAWAERLLVAGELVLAREPLRLAAWLLGRRSAKLGLDSSPLRLDAWRIPLR